jgi:GT2 family glycosyltransferase
MKDPGLHAVVLNYCQLEETLECVEALAATGLPRVQILVVDNASPDGSGEVLERELSEVRVLRLPENGGYGAGNNAGIEYLWRSSPASPPRCVFIVNPDVRVGSDTIDELDRVLSEDGRRGGVSCVQYDAGDPERLDEVFRRWMDNRGIDVAAIRDGDFVPTESLLGAAMMLTRDAIERVGGFDPLYFMYAEEEDLARRLRFHGFDIGLAAGARVRHGRPYLSLSRGEREAQKRASRYLFLLKDPFRPTSVNSIRILAAARWHLARALSSSESSVAGWMREVRWFLGRARAGLTHRKQEMAGPTHLDLPEATAVREEPGSGT